MTAIPFGAFGHTDVGRTRADNQDSYLCLALESGPVRGYLLAVADGMGGHAAGDMASEIAITALRERMLGPSAMASPAPADAKGLLTDVLSEANRRILQQAEDNPQLHGMGSTMVAALIVDRRVWLANVGDSRAYLASAASLEQLTSDHTWELDEAASGGLSAAEVENSPFRGMLTRSLGASPELVVDAFERELRDGEYVLLCSDGLYREVSDSEIVSVVQGCTEPEPICRRLIDLANAAGGSDNITCVIAGPAGDLSQETAHGKDTKRFSILSAPDEDGSS